MCTFRTILVLLVYASFAHGANKVKIWLCKDATLNCTLVPNVTQAEVNDPNQCVVFESGDWYLEYHAYFNGLGLSNRRLNFGICYGSEFENDLIMDANTNSVIADKFSSSYLVHICKTIMSFKTPADTWLTFKNSWVNEVMPYLNKLKSDPKKNKRERFDLRGLLKYLRKHDSIKGSMRGQRKLEEDLQNRFGNIFSMIHAGYENKQFTVSENEGVFYSLILGKEQNLLYKYLSSIAENRVKFGGRMFEIMYEGVVDGNYKPMVKGTTLNCVTMYLYKTPEQAANAQEQGTFSSKEVEKNCDCSDYSILMAKDSASGNSVVNFKSTEGTADTYIMYNTNAWTFYCALTKYLLVIPEGPNFALYNFAHGVGIVVCKETGRAVFVKKSSEDIRVCSHINHILEAIEIIVKITKETKHINMFNTYYLSFPNFLRHSYFTSRTDLLLTGMRCKMQLMRHFGEFSKGFMFVKGYGWNDGSDNAVLYFFKNVCVNGVRQDYKNMVDVVASCSSGFFCKEVLQATYTCALERYSM